MSSTDPETDQLNEESASGPTSDDVTSDEATSQESGEESVSDSSPDEGGQGSDGEEQAPKLSLDVQINETSACERHITVSIARDDVERYFDKEYDELMPEAEVRGFRKGHAPRKLVERWFRERVSDKVKGTLLMDSMTQISEEQEFSAISEPDFDFDVVAIPDDGPLTFEFDIEVRPEFEMPEWKGLKIERPTREFTDADIDRQIAALLTEYGQLVPHDGAAEADDYVTLDLEFRHNGKTLSRATEQTVRLKPRLSFRDGTLEGFAELVIGAEAGAKLHSTIRLSSDLEDEELRGEDVEIELNVLDVKKVELPQLDEKLLDRIGDFEREEELRESIRNELQRQLAYYQRQRVREQITEMLTESADWELPPDLLKRQSHREWERAVMEMQAAGFSDAQIRARENEMRQNSTASTARALREHFILERIAEDQSIEESPEEYDQEIMLIALQQNDTPRRVRARLEKRGQMDVLRNQIIERKVIDLITSSAEFTEVKYEPEASETEAVDLSISVDADSVIPEAKPGGEATPLPQQADHT